MTTYKIVRGYRDDSDKRLVVETDLTLEEAREWCRDSETSSRTCTTDEAIAHTEEHGPWFDGYEEE